MVEEERKYEVDARFSLPDLTECVPDGGRGRDPAAGQAPRDVLRHRRPSAGPGRCLAAVPARRRRRSVDREAADRRAGHPQRDLDRRGDGRDASRPTSPTLVTVYTRGAPLQPVVTIRTTRVRHDLMRPRTTGSLVEVVDDTVTVLDGRRSRRQFREIEVERKAGRRKLLDRVEMALRDAGAAVGRVHRRNTYGRWATRPRRPPDLVPPAASPGRNAERRRRRDVRAAARHRPDLAHDPLVRLRASIGNGDTAVHQMRVGFRRLRSDLRTFEPLRGRAG